MIRKLTLFVLVNALVATLVVAVSHYIFKPWQASRISVGTAVAFLTITASYPYLGRSSGIAARVKVLYCVVIPALFVLCLALVSLVAHAPSMSNPSYGVFLAQVGQFVGAWFVAVHAIGLPVFLLLAFIYAKSEAWLFRSQSNKSLKPTPPRGGAA